MGSRYAFSVISLILVAERLPEDKTFVPKQGFEAPVVESLTFRSEEAGRDTRNLEAVVGNTSLTVTVTRAIARAGTIFSHHCHQSFTLPSKAR